MRLDIFLTKNHDVQSRNKACELIKTSKVKVNGEIITKPSFNVEQTHTIELLEEQLYVSRAAYKLKYFLEEIPLDIKGKKALDIGSSTGGFTQILLEKEVESVTCVDVGSNQLHESIKYHAKISFHEQCDIRNFKAQTPFELVTCDVSFISLHHILDAINELSSHEIIILFKPQFEVGNHIKRDKKGVVKDAKAIEKARSTFIEATRKLNWTLQYHSLSQLEGKEGNQEELLYFIKQ
ncbi:TlyA family RNA methyltransferase [Candidatus Marinarcus aquaticus]|uniref:23S rRNA (cytidine-2'-O)-methyltransferase TlyA n=1 Tax=Candidatus Marinarcus aquaticus TaxID=2044504 RepID=UPI001D1798D7|nr:TlyA family RNA methyltransferase [Candidatus Marinarcus aquaticus]